MRGIRQRHLRVISRRFWGAVFTLVIAVAVLVQLGREAFPLLNEYKNEIAETLGEALGVDIAVGEVSASWKGLTPKLELVNLSVNAKNGQRVFNIGRASAELSLLDSIAEFGYAWRRIVLTDLEVVLQQDDSGRWQIAGLSPPSGDNNSFIIDDPLDVFLFGRRVEIKNSKIDFNFRTGHHTQVTFPVLTLDNDRDFHRLQAEMEVDADSKAFTFVVEGYGDPRAPDNFDASGYLELQHFPMEKVLAAMGTQFWQYMDEARWSEGHRIDLSLWFNGTSSKGLTLQGKMRADGLPLKLPENILLPQQVHSDITGSWSLDKGWEMVFQDLNIEWPDISAPVLDLKVYGRMGEKFGIATQNLHLGEWREMLSAIGVAERKAGEVINELNPQGVLETLDVQLVGREEGHFRLRANVRDASVDAYKGAPQLKNVNGYVSLSAFDGFINVDSPDGMSVHLPKVYHDPLNFTRARGQVRWHVDPREKFTYLSSGLLEAATEDEQGQGYLYLKLPFKKEVGEPEMTLSIGVKESLAANYRKYVPYRIPDSLYNWLDKSVRSGKVKDISFLFHGSIDKDPAIRPTIQLYGSVSEARLAFSPDWPVAENVDASLALDGASLDVQINNARLAGNNITDATVKLLNNPHDSGQALAINGKMTGSVESAMGLLQASPVREMLGTTFDRWQYSGRVDSAVQLMIPLQADARGRSEKVRVALSNAQLSMTDLDLPFENINGTLSYSTDGGLSSDHLAGVLWGEPVAATIQSPQKEENHRDIKINYTGRVGVENLREWLSRPELYFARGETVVNGTVSIPAGYEGSHDVLVEMTSDLDGVELQLPRPLNKSAETKKTLAVKVEVDNSRQFITLNYDEMATFRLERFGSQLENMQLAFNDKPLKRRDGYFDVNGTLDNIDLKAWNLVKDSYIGYVAAHEKENGSDEGDALPVKLNLKLNRGFYNDTEVTNLYVQGLGVGDNWNLDLKSKMISGNVKIPAGNAPIRMTLDYLNLPVKDEQSQEYNYPGEINIAQKESAFNDFDPATVIPIDFSTKNLLIGGENYGAWQFQLRPVESGLLLKNLYATIRQMQIGGRNDKNDPAGAEFIWLRTDEGDTSQFIGTLTADNVADVLTAWDLEKLMESQSAQVNIAAHWRDAPDEISFENITGLVSLDFRNGNFIRGAEAGENPLLRLFALFNFDTLARRLRLDFSDLAKEGFAFDHVYGDLDIAGGKIYLPDPLIVESTSSRMQMGGVIDVVNEEVDSELVVTLPVAGNLAVATAFVAGLPAGIGVYVVSKLFKRQVDKVSSINYAVTGDWEDPKIKVRKIFDDTAARKKSDRIKAESNGGDNGGEGGENHLNDAADEPVQTEISGK